jgi:glycosyltransferase 2 family protein
MKKKLALFLKLTITGLFFLYIFSTIDVHHFAATLRNARLDILLSGFLVLWIAHYICIYRWRMLMRPLMPALSLKNLFGIYCIGLFFNLTFPTIIGGDVVKIYYAGKPSKSYARSFAAVFLDRDAGMLAMMIIASTAIFFYPVSVPGISVALVIWGVFLVFILGNVAVFTPRIHRLLISGLQYLKLPKIALKVNLISDVFQIMGNHRKVLWGSLAISFLNQLLVISVTWIMAIGLHLDIPARYFLVFMPVITLISMIPVSLNGMGLREFSFMTLFGAIGVPAEECIALGLLSSVMIILSSLPGGLVYILFRNKTDRQQLAALETNYS